MRSLLLLFSVLFVVPAFAQVSKVNPVDIGSGGAGTGQVLTWNGTLSTFAAPNIISVNGAIGTVVLTKTDVGLGNVDNTTDLNKPISTATQTALNLKYNIPAGTTLQYVRGDGTLATLPVVTGESTTVANTATINLSLSGNQITGIVNDASITPAKLSQAYLTAEVDGSISNELQVISLVGTALTLSNTGGTANFTAWDTNAADDFNAAYASLTGIPSTFAPSAHTHAQSEVTGLVTALAGKYATPTGTTLQYVRGDGTLATLPVVTGESTTVANTGTINLSLSGNQITGIVNDASITPAKLSQAYLTAEVDGSIINELQVISLVGTALTLSNTGGTANFTGWDTNAADDFNAAYASLTGIPSTFAPSAHTHAQSEVTGLVSALAGKFPTPTGTTLQYVRGDGTLATLPVVTGESTTVANTGTINLSLSGNQITGIVNDGSITPAKLSQAYLTAEVDGSTSNELQVISLVGTALTLSNTGGTANFTAWDTNAADDFNAAYASLTGIPSTFVPSAHTHAQSEVTGLVTALAGKYATPTGTTLQYVRGDGTLATYGAGGDILNGGNTGAVTIGTNNATALDLETNNVSRVTITSAGITEINSGFRLKGALYDVNNNNGTTYSFLASTTTGVNWLPAGFIPTTTVIGTTTTATANNRYIPNSSGLVTITMPANASVGHRLFITGKGSGGWKLAQVSGQTIHGATDTTTGTAGFIASTSRYDCVELICIIDNTDWVIQNYSGTLTIN